VEVAETHITQDTDEEVETPKHKRKPEPTLVDAERVLFTQDDSGLPRRSQPKAPAAPKPVPVSADLKLERL